MLGDCERLSPPVVTDLTRSLLSLAGGSVTMSPSPWSWVMVGGAVAVVLAMLRWEFADFVLDRIGALTEWMRNRRSREDST